MFPSSKELLRLDLLLISSKVICRNAGTSSGQTFELTDCVKLRGTFLWKPRRTT